MNGASRDKHGIPLFHFYFRIYESADASTFKNIDDFLGILVNVLLMGGCFRLELTIGNGYVFRPYRIFIDKHDPFRIIQVSYRFVPSIFNPEHVLHSISIFKDANGAAIKGCRPVRHALFHTRLIITYFKFFSD